MIKDIQPLPYGALVTRTRKEFKLHEERRYKPSDKSGVKRKLKLERLRENEEFDY